MNVRGMCDGGAEEEWHKGGGGGGGLETDSSRDLVSRVLPAAT